MADVLGLLERVRALRSALIAFESGCWSGEDCAVLVEELAVLEKVSAAARLRAAVSVGAAGVHRARGFADVPDWMARATGSSCGSVKSALETAAALEEQPAAKAALVAGELSIAQAHELVKTEAACPGSTVDLLDVAQTGSLKALKDEGRNRRARAVDPEELHRRQRAARRFRHWRTSLGTIGFAGELPPELGVPIMNRLEAETDRLWIEAGRMAKSPRCAKSNERLGTAERRAAIAADAFMRLVETGGKGKAHSAELVIVCDLDAYRRGRVEQGERCHIVGGGPIPVSLARDVGRDAFLKAVLHRGTNIGTVAHFGRRVPAVLRTALELGPAPEFDGVQCSVPSCDRRFHLQRDHIDPVGNGGVTALANFQALCWMHHHLKTEADREAGLLRSPPHRLALARAAVIEPAGTR